MSIQQELIPDTNIYVVRIAGRLDQSLNAELETVLDELIGTETVNVIIDLTATNYINSGGLRTLVSAWRRARKHDGTVKICGLSERLYEIFTMVGFDKVFDVYPDCQAARGYAH